VEAKKYYFDARLVGSYLKGDILAISRLQESSARYFQRPSASYLDYDTTRNSLSGVGGRVKIGKGSGLWRYSTGVSWYSPELELNDLGYMQIADHIRQENEISYLSNQPFSIFRMINVRLEQFNSLNFAGKYLGSGSSLMFSSEYLNKWGTGFHILWESNSLDTRLLRGGPDMKVPAEVNFIGEFRTDSSKPVYPTLGFDYRKRESNSANRYNLTPGLMVRPINTLRLGISASYGRNKDQFQFVTKLEEATRNRYILGTIDQQTLGLTFRADYSITPEFSIQYYGSPFISIGNFSDYKEVVNPLADEYQARFIPYRGDLSNPDFNFHQFRSNMVVKWEFRPGSFAYLIWSDDRTGFASPTEADLIDSMKQMWKIAPGNLFLLKINYWFSI
jgi:hypothetical protein